MSENSPSRIVRFSVFEVNLQSGELRRQGQKVKLQEQPFQVLAALLERPGELVTREELRTRLWATDTFVDFDHSLNAAIKRLRDALGESAEAPVFIETLARRGYRFIAPVETPSGANGAIEAVQPIEDTRQERTKATLLSKWRYVVPAAVILVLVAIGVRWMARSADPRVPRVVSSMPLTNDGLPKGGRMVTDGSRIYFTERQSGRWLLKEMSSSGGESAEIATPFQSVEIYDISPNASELLIGGDVVQKMRELWILPIPAGPPYRVGAILVSTSCWAPDGEHIVYTSGNEMYSAKKDGTESRRLATLPGGAGELRYSLDGRRIRFTAFDPVRASLEMWEIREGDQTPQPVLPGKKPPHNCCGTWSPDGKLFFFQTFMLNTHLDQDLWVLSDASPLNKPSEPVRMTNGPLALGSPIPSTNGKKLFVRGTQARAKLLRYDAGSGTFQPYLGGISASDVEISRDGQWVTYVSYPELTLWRSRVDGSDRRQLTFAPVEAFLPRWSPDGTRIVFTDLQLGKSAKIYIVSRDGGVPEAAMPDDKGNEIDPTWSPDGASIVFARSHLDRDLAIYRVGLKTRLISKIGGSDELTGPRLSPDGRYLVALSRDWTKLMLYDFRTEKWTELAAVVKGAIGYPNWSRDGRYVYFENANPDWEFSRVATTNGEIRSIVKVGEIPQPRPTWMGLAADDSPLLRQDVSSQEIYELDLEFP